MVELHSNILFPNRVTAGAPPEAAYVTTTRRDPTNTCVNGVEARSAAKTGWAQSRLAALVAVSVSKATRTGSRGARVVHAAPRLVRPSPYPFAAEATI
jgi:hypothetical protein